MHRSVTTENDVPLCVDLDGTLLRSDMLWESLIRLLKKNPFYLFPVLGWWLRGRAVLKAEIAKRTSLDVAALPFNQALIDFLRIEKDKGRRLILATASDLELARQVANHIELFNEVLASDGNTNLRGRNKVELLVKRFGRGGFDYAGNSTVDLPVWEQARHAMVVSSSQGLANRARRLTQVTQTFIGGNLLFASVLRMLRPHQWVKNLIIFVPLLTAHELSNPTILRQGILAFVAFSLAASAVYVLNDLMDVEADRHHSTKRNRPFASGDLPLPFGLVISPVLFVASALVAWLLPWGFAAVLGTYVLLTSSYSVRLKEVPLLDVFCLAALYTVRLVAGHAATNIEYSFWLLVFSMFIFLSLALLKRFTELSVARRQSKTEIKGRGYATSDLELVATLGTASGYLSVLVMALYVHSPEGGSHYNRPTILLLICPLLLYWISRVWMVAHRNQMHDDPIVFALKDRVSYIVGALTLVVLWLATG